VPSLPVYVSSLSITLPTTMSSTGDYTRSPSQLFGTQPLAGQTASTSTTSTSTSSQTEGTSIPECTCPAFCVHHIVAHGARVTDPFEPGEEQPFLSRSYLTAAADPGTDERETRGQG
jgi:hypothetical protein